MKERRRVAISEADRRALAGQRLTGQRRLLLNLIFKEGGHLDADELFRKAKQQEPRLSLSTVYRTLRLFKQLGIVSERHFAEEHHHYEGRPSKEHYHLVCLGCGRIVEFESPWMPKLKTEVGQENDFAVSSAEVNLFGLCARCRRKAST